MHVKQLTNLILTSFEAVGFDDDGTEVKDTIKIWLNRLAFKTVTEEGFRDAMEKADTDPTVIGDLLAGKNGAAGVLGRWEVFEDAEKSRMLPITREQIINLPYDFVVQLSEAVIAKLFPGQRTAASSPAGSEPKENTSPAAETDTTEIPPPLPADTISQEPAASGA